MNPPSNAPQPSFEEISQLAYHLWRQAGCPAGQDLKFWVEAEQLTAAKLKAQNQLAVTDGNQKTIQKATKASETSKTSAKRAAPPSGNNSNKRQPEATKKAGKAR
jgi:hypothetical protein